MCEHCGARFEVASRQAGSITNCPECGLATPVPGGFEALFWLLVAATVVGILGFGYLVSIAYGLGVAVGLTVLALVLVIIYLGAFY